MLGLKLGAEQRDIGSLPLRLGGCAFGTVSERAGAAYVTGWRRDIWKRADRSGISMPDADLEVLPATKRMLNEAVGKIIAQAPQMSGSELLNFNSKPPSDLQRLLAKEVMDEKNRNVCERLSTGQRAGHRKCGGVGSGGFMLAPEQGVEAMAAGAWRIAVRRRLLCAKDALVYPSRSETQCQHRGKHGVCGEALSAEGAVQHVAGCKRGGHVVETHDAVRDVLWAYVKEKVDQGALREQRLEALRGGAGMEVDNAEAGAAEGTDTDEEELQQKDILDVVWTENGCTVAIDVAIVGAHASRGRLQAQASRDGVAAKHAERAKRRRYEGLPITPFVLEIGGRPGEAAVGVVRALAARAVGDASREAATLWQKISIALQTGVGRTIACGLVSPGAVSAAGAA